MSSQPSTTQAHAGLKRALGLWDLVIIGIIMIQPTAPMPLFGIVDQEARGHVVTAILIAMVAMMFTAVSYGRMARAYPSAGSAYTYVGRELHSGLGFLTGWSVSMDYILNPLICVIWCSKAARNIVPEIPYVGWVIIFAVLLSLLNLRGIRATARTNQILVIGMSAVIIAMFVATVRFLLNMTGLSAGYFIKPFYDPQTFSLGAISTGTSIAVLTYIGFDGISTLSEEVHNPRRNILIATVLVCFIVGILSSLEVYAAQLVWPDYKTFPDVDTAYVHVAGRAGGPILFQVVNFTLLIASVGSGMSAQLAAARLLYGMGRDGALPRRFFSALNPRTGIPQNNVLFVGAIALIGAFTLSYQMGAELLNFGAFIAFMGVNAAAFVHYWLRGERKLTYFLPPIAGFVICLYIWLNLNTPAKIAGACWLIVGAVFAAWKTNGFRRPIAFSEPPPE
jgi:putrescine importer